MSDTTQTPDMHGQTRIPATETPNSEAATFLEVNGNPFGPVDIRTQEPPSFKRDINGLVEGVTYKYKKSGYRTVIDWRAMVLPEHLVFNKQYQKDIEEKHGKPLDQISVTEAEDKHLLILLAGIKELAELRGYLKVKTRLVKVERDHCAATCDITWMPNFETCGNVVTRSGIAGATLENTNGFGQIFLETIAGNRAFVRSVRDMLGINVVGQDEVGGKFKYGPKAEQAETTVSFSANSLLEQRCSDKRISFDAFKKRVVEAHKDKLRDKAPEDWTSFASIKAIDATVLLEIVNNAG